MKRLVLFVEGEGEAQAMPRLVKRLLTEQDAWASGRLWLDENPFRVGQVGKLAKHDFREWKRKLAASAKRPNLGGVLLVLDGDQSRWQGEAFCAAVAAGRLASEARSVGAGVTFSVAVVFARQEFESWLIAGIDSVAGQRLPDGRLIAPAARPPESNLEESPRDAKAWLSRVVEGGYRPTRDQAALATLVTLDTIRNRQLRSFRRLESAVSQLALAIASDAHVVTPP